MADIVPYKLPEEAGFFSALHDTLMDTKQQTELQGAGTLTDVDGNPIDHGILPAAPAPTTNLDLSGAIAPLPTTAGTPQASEHDKLAAARVVLGTGAPSPEALGDPGMMDKKVGTEKTSSTQSIQSDASKSAAKETDAASADSKAATDLAVKGVDDVAKAESDYSEAMDKATATVENARVAVHQSNAAKFQDVVTAIDNEATELANYKPETFWGSKSGADKITAALSVGLGSFGQAMLGSGSNVGQMLLERKMGEFDRNQQLVYNNKLKHIENMKGSLQLKRQLADDADKTFDAMKIAARAQVSSQNARAIAMAKTSQVKAQLGHQQAVFDQNTAKLHEEIASKHEKKITSETEKDVLKQVQRTGGTTDDGKPLNAEQGNSLLAYSAAGPAEKNLRAVNWQKLSKDPQWQSFLEAQQRYQEMSAQGSVGGFAALGTALLPGTGKTGSPYEVLARDRPDLASIVSNMSRYTAGVLRKESGAAIGKIEKLEKMNDYFPIYGETGDLQAQKNEARAAQLDALMQTTGQYEQLRRKGK